MRIGREPVARSEPRSAAQGCKQWASVPYSAGRRRGLARASVGSRTRSFRSWGRWRAARTSRSIVLLRRRRARTAGTATASGIRPIGRRWTAELLPLLPRFLLTAPEYLPPKRQQSVFPGDNRKVETEYTVVEADRLKASHTPSYAQRSTEEYPAEIQGRAYHGSRGRQAREHAAICRNLVILFRRRRCLPWPSASPCRAASARYRLPLQTQGMPGTQSRRARPFGRTLPVQCELKARGGLRSVRIDHDCV